MEQGLKGAPFKTERAKSLGAEAAKSPREIRGLVEDAYARAGEPDCCDPRDLCEGNGLAPVPADIEVPFVRNGLLFYPEGASIERRGLGLYYELAMLISPRDIVAVMDELILPTRSAKRLTVPELAHVQPNAPLARVLSIYMRHGHRSGQWAALSR
jgi:hypothetical protein